MYTLPKNAPHAFAHAVPWDQFKGKRVGRKEASAKEVFKPGHKENASITQFETSSGAYGAHLGGPARAIDPRKNFGGFSTNTDDDATAKGLAQMQIYQQNDSLGPVDLVQERRHVTRTQKLEADAVDTLRWNGGERHSSALVNRRRAAEVAAAASMPHPLEAKTPTQENEGGDDSVSAKRRAALAAKRKDDAPPVDPLRARVGKGEIAQRHADQQRVRAMLEEERKNAEVAKANAVDARMLGPHGYGNKGGGMSQEERRAALQDPRVQAALDQALNGPNRVAYQQNLTRNTTRASAERRW